MAGLVRAPRDLLAGLFFVVVGVGTLVVGADYRLGTLLSMGPGYFPRIIAILLILLGAVIVLASLRLQGPPLERWRLGPMVLVLGSIVVFGWLLERFGLMAAVAAMVLVSSYAERGRSHVETIVLAVALTALAWLIFVKGLGMPIMVWPEGMGG